MKIELKNIQFSEALSEETYAFSANLYINDIKAGVAQNRGHGGSTDYFPYNDKGRELIRKAEEWCGAQPPEKYIYEGNEYTSPVTLESRIDHLINAFVQQKDIRQFRKKIDKAMENAIVIGVPDQSFRTLGLKYPVDLLLMSSKGPEILRSVLEQRIIPNLKEGEIILNTNIPEQILKDAGLSEKDYLPPVSQPRKITRGKNKGNKQ